VDDDVDSWYPTQPSAQITTSAASNNFILQRYLKGAPAVNLDTAAGTVTG